MRPSFARTTFRAASSLVSRNTFRSSSFPARTCSSSAALNEPIVKHSVVGSVSSSSSSTPSRCNNAQPLASTVVSELSAKDSNRTDQSTNAFSGTVAPSSASGVMDISADPENSKASIASESPDLTHLNSVEASEFSSASPANDVSQSSQQIDSKTCDDDVVAPITDGALSGPNLSKSELASSDQSKSDEGHHTPGDSPSSLCSELRAYLQRNAVRSALFHFIAALKVDGTPGIDKSVLKLILPVLGRYGWAPTALDGVNLALSREYDLETSFYNCALHAMSRSGDYDTIQSVIKRMWKLPADSRPNATSYNYLIASFMYRGAVDRAFDVLQDMKEHMIYPTFATYHSLISGCLRSNDPRRAYTTLNAVERQRFDIGAMTVSQVLVSCADSDLSDEALQLLPRLKEAMPQYEQELHRIAEKRNAYRMASSKRTTVEERAEVRGAPRLELGAISAILHCAFRNCRADLALAGWSLLRNSYPDIHVPSTLWYCVIGALAGSGNFEKAFEFLGVMRENGYNIRLKDLEAALVKPLSLDINKIDENYYRLCDKAKEAKSGNLEAAATTNSSDDLENNPRFVANQEIVESKEEKNIQGNDAHPIEAEEGTILETIGDGAPRTESLRDVLADRVSLDTISEGLEEMESARSVGIDEVNCIIAACSYAGDLDRAFQTYDEVESVFGLEKNVETYIALLEGCIQVKHVRGGLRIVSEMERVGLKLDGEVLHLIVRLLTRAGRAPECISLLKKVRNEGGAISLRSYLLLIRYFVRGDLVDSAAQIIRLGEEDGHDSRTLMGRIDYNGTKKLNEALGVSKDDRLIEEDELTTVEGDGLEMVSIQDSEDLESSKRSE